MNTSDLILLGTALLLGLRHGIDWDHIAAITDISGSQDNPKKAFTQGLTYALGHGTVIIIFGLLAVVLGVKLPASVDSIMARVVGATLVILGIWLLVTIATAGKDFKLKSRWMLLFDGIRKLRHFLNHRLNKHDHSHEHLNSQTNIGAKTAFGVGMIHGIGAETPTQLLIFVTAAGAGGAKLGVLLVLTFVLGLIISNSLITLLSILGINRFKKNSILYLGLGTVSGIFSLVIGLLFLTGKTSILPVIFGG